jgi:hypothetical protein
MVVAKGGIEPPTRGFSIPSNTHLLLLIVVDILAEVACKSTG